jgi:anti-anti-sigma regulatory factor
VDLSGVDSCDAAALQLLCAAKLSASRLRKTFRVVSLSPAVLETCAAIGLPLAELAAQEVAGAI